MTDSTKNTAKVPSPPAGDDRPRGRGGPLRAFGALPIWAKILIPLLVVLWFAALTSGDEPGGESDQLTAEIAELRSENEDLRAENEQLAEQAEAPSADEGDASADEGDAARLEELESENTALMETNEGLQAQVADLEEKLAEQPVDEEPEAAAGDYSAGQYTINDVQVSEDFAGDFQVRARVTNTGGDVESLGMTATLFNDGSVVGTANGIANDLASGATVTTEFTSLDGYEAWDEVEFQVEFEF